MATLPFAGPKRYRSQEDDMPITVPDLEDEFDDAQAQMHPCPNPMCPLVWASLAAAVDCCVDD